MITAIFIDNKGFRRAEVLPAPAPPTYRFPCHRNARRSFDPTGPQFQAGQPFSAFYVNFYRRDKIAEDVYEYVEE